MSRISHCQACYNLKHGIKTRLPVPHTCEQATEPVVIKCRCDCHKHPGCYRMPCSVCGHDDNDGTFIGGVVNGHWEKI
ncbi:hypothetical protein [Fulvivirga imtechensis]|uniref:hypothetical protein n=1 Tax=Fulvivirga imtechensis TaxID=881893 RepID=UPI0012F95534|nr:hypothetical protein [Fulvivirga imtechensis]